MAATDPDVSVDPSDRAELWDFLETVATRSQTGLHIPVTDDDEIRPLCGWRDGGRGPSGDWMTKSRSTYPGRADDLCDNCLQNWVDRGKPDLEMIGIPLTNRQRETVVTAYRMGYFEWPREADMTDIANEIGLEQSTVSQHRRRAFHTLLETIELKDVETLTDRQREVLATAKEMAFSSGQGRVLTMISPLSLVCRRRRSTSICGLHCERS